MKIKFDRLRLAINKEGWENLTLDYQFGGIPYFLNSAEAESWCEMTYKGATNVDGREQGTQIFFSHWSV